MGCYADDHNGRQLQSCLHHQIGSETLPNRALLRAGSDKKGAAASAPAAAQLALGPFTLEPACGEVAPGARQEVSVVYRADSGACLSREQLLVVVPDRDPADQPAGIPLELTAESCIPGGCRQHNAAACRRPDSY